MKKIIYILFLLLGCSTFSKDLEFQISEVERTNIKILLTDSSLGHEKEKTLKPEVKLKNYKIKKGDTLSSLAKKFSNSITDLQKLNSIKNINVIFEGKILKYKEY